MFFVHIKCLIKSDFEYPLQAIQSSGHLCYTGQLRLHGEMDRNKLFEQLIQVLKIAIKNQ